MMQLSICFGKLLIYQMKNIMMQLYGIPHISRLSKIIKQKQIQQFDLLKIFHIR